MRIVNNRNHYDNDEDKSGCDDGNANDFDSNVIDNNGNDVYDDNFDNDKNDDIDDNNYYNGD